MKILVLQCTLECDDTANIELDSPIVGYVQELTDAAAPHLFGVAKASVAHLYGEEPIQDV